MIVGIGKVGEGKHNVSIRVDPGTPHCIRLHGVRLSLGSGARFGNARLPHLRAYRLINRRPSHEAVCAFLPVITLILRSTSSVLLR